MFIRKKKGQEQTYEVPEEAILDKLENDPKLHLVEHFSIQPLDSSVPKDFIDDFKNNENIENEQFQLKRLQGLGGGSLSTGIGHQSIFKSLP